MVHFHLFYSSLQLAIVHNILYWLSVWRCSDNFNIFTRCSDYRWQRSRIASTATAVGYFLWSLRATLMVGGTGSGDCRRQADMSREARQDLGVQSADLKERWLILVVGRSAIQAQRSSMGNLWGWLSKMHAYGTVSCAVHIAIERDNQWTIFHANAYEMRHIVTQRI